MDMNDQSNNVNELMSSSEIVNNFNELVDVSNKVEITKNQLKIFIVSQARDQLQKLLQINEKIDQWTDRYIEIADDWINDTDASPDMIETYLSMIISLADRSFDMIKSVASDEKLLNLTLIDMSSTVNNNINSSISSITDSRSRSKIIDAVQNVLNYIDNNDIKDIVDCSDVKDEESL